MQYIYLKRDVISCMEVKLIRVCVKYSVYAAEYSRAENIPICLNQQHSSVQRLAVR